VLRDFSKKGYINNSGFVYNVKMNTLISLNKYLDDSFFADYDKFSSSQYYCPSDRCNQVCQNVSQDRFESIDLGECRTSY